MMRKRKDEIDQDRDMMRKKKGEKLTTENKTKDETDQHQDKRRKKGEEPTIENMDGTEHTIAEPTMQRETNRNHTATLLKTGQTGQTQQQTNHITMPENQPQTRRTN